MEKANLFYTATYEKLKAHADDANASQMQAYMKDIAPYFGVKAPLRKEIFREVYGLHAPSSLKELDAECRLLLSAPRRELHYCGMELYYRKKRLWEPDTIDTMEEFMMMTPWWDTIDFMAKNWIGSFVKAFPNEGMRKIVAWNASNDIWLIRTSILFQLGYKDEVDVEVLHQMIAPHTLHPDFFIRKAIGWALRQYAKYNPEWVLAYVQSNQLSPLSEKEATKHIA